MRKRKLGLQATELNWQKFIDGKFRLIIDAQPLAFSNMKPAMVPQVGGVYLITAMIGRREIPYYIGRSKNLRRRLYGNHLMGSLANARLKKYLISTRECKDIHVAKKFIRERCHVRWIEEPDIRRRGAIEGYATGLLFPKHGIYEEH